VAGKKVTVPFNFGRQDRTAPKHAPFGVLGQVKNLRHREVGGLGLRNGYQPLAMTTPSASLVAYDLHEYGGRLIALGSSTSDGYPSDIWEYLGVTGQAGGLWRQGDPAAPRTPLGPFTNMRQVAGIPHPEGGVSFIDGAAGGGYVCLSYRTASGTGCNTLIVRQSDDQTILFERAGNNGLTSFLSGRVVFAAGKFLLMGAASSNAVSILQFTPGTSTAWTAFATVDGANANAVAALDIVAIGNPTTAAVVVAFDRTGSVNLDIKAYSSAGAQVGSTISLGSTSTNQIALEADQTANQILMLSRDGATMNLRTWNFAGTLLAGPTATTNGSTGQLVRVRWTFAMPSNGPAVNAVINNSSNGITIEQYNPATHALNYSQVVQGARLQTRAIDSSGPGSSTLDSVSFGALIGPFIANSDTSDATNALFTCARVGGFQHVRRNYINAKAVGAGFGLSLDSSTGKVLWVAGEDDGSELVMPSLALLDFKSTARRQSAQFAGLLYLAGATPLVYDGRIAVEPGFDLPGVLSATPSNGIGSLTPGATYSYQVHFEFTLSNGSIIEGPPSAILNVTMGGSDDTNTIVVQTPHCIAISLGGATYGADVTAVLSRTEWSPSTINPSTGAAGAQLSVFRRAKTQAVPTGAANYGATLNIVDSISDVDLADEAPIYTQSERGALSGTLEHNLAQACSYITATEGRMLTGGLVRSFEFQISKEAFLGSVFNWSEFSSFFGQVSGPLKAVHALDSTRLLFTRDEILVFGGNGPDDLGAGSIPSPLRIPTVDGLKDWRSLLEIPEGLFLQLDDDKLYLLPRGAGSPVWVGRDILRELKAYPTITGAARHRADNAALFAVNTTAETSGKLIVHDLEFKTWLVDEPPLQASSGISAIVPYGRSMAYASGGVVYVQSATSFTDSASTPITGQPITRPLYPFGLGGYGQICEGLLSFEFRGNCDLQARVSYDDGITFSSLKTFTLTGTVGQQMRRKWAFPKTVTSSVVLEFTVVPTGTGTEGIIFNELDLLVIPEDGLGELDPGELG
jgi:hypothetical protein